MRMAAMLAAMLMGMHLGVSGMGILGGVFVEIPMRMHVPMFMGMNDLPMSVLMAVCMGMFMRMEMLMFVPSFQDRHPLKTCPNY